jgi:4-hydroxybenzoate polyprenyltransferase
MLQLYLLFFLIFMCAFVFFITDRPGFILFFRTLRWPQHIYYTALTAAGFFLAAKQAYLPDKLFWPDFAAVILLINILFISSLILNNLYDKQIDLINKKENALNHADFTRKEYLVIYFVLLALSLGLAFSLSIYAAAVTLIMHAAAYVYSCPPLRIKNIFLLNTIFMSLASLLAFFLGYVLPAGAPVFSIFPRKFALALLFSLTLVFFSLDVNDYAGDKKYGVATVMTLLGPRNGRLAAAALALAGYLLMAFMLGSPYLLAASLLFGSATFVAIYLPKKRINEAIIFLIMFLYTGIFAWINPAGF